VDLHVHDRGSVRFPVWTRSTTGLCASSTSGGQWPVWSRDGRTLFFRSGREVRAVAATVTGDGIPFGEGRAVLEWDVARSFEVGPDRTFYGVEPVPGAAEQTSLELQTGWFAEVERLAGPAKR
jgi:hypothetical protein